MPISDLLPRLLELLGLKASPKVKFQKIERLLLQKKAINEDRLEGLKDKIARIERQAIAKKREHDGVRGDRKGIVAGEIERLFQALDRCWGEEGILSRNLAQVGLGLAKVSEILAAIDSGVEQSVFDDLALELQDIISEMKEVDQEAKELEATRYTPPRTEAIDIDARIAVLEADRPEADATTAQPQYESSEGLSESSMNRIKELDAEDD